MAVLPPWIILRACIVDQDIFRISLLFLVLFLPFPKIIYEFLQIRTSYTNLSLLADIIIDYNNTINYKFKNVSLSDSKSIKVDSFSGLKQSSNWSYVSGWQVTYPVISDPVLFNAKW